MNKRIRGLAVAFVTSFLSAYAAADVRVLNDVTGVVSYLSSTDFRTSKSGEAAARAYLRRYRKALGIADISKELRLVGVVRVGERARYNFQQIRRGRRVLNALVGVTLQKDGRSLQAIASSFNPLAKAVNAVVKLKAADAVKVARSIHPSAAKVRARELVMIQPVPSRPELKFVWLVDVEAPDVATFMTYAVDAVDGFIEDSSSLVHSALDRLTRDAQTNATRKEGSSRSGNADLDAAHDAAGAAYNYFAKELGFDSFDGAGGTIQSLVNDPKSKNNAFYRHKSKGLYFGPGMATLDVAVHEFSHGVIAHTAGLVYKGQSGALNESYADVFGAIVDADDWLLGEDLPKSFLRGKPALRDMRRPEALRQPGKVADYQPSCGVDFDGVHINSGIPNRGFYEVASRIGRSDAGKIYFQALTGLSANADFNTHRQATLDAARAHFAGKASKVSAVEAGLAAAGLVEGMKIEVCPTSSCPIAGSARRLRGAERQEFGKNIAAAYRLRDEVLKRHSTIGDFMLENYREISGDLARAIFTNPAMALDVLGYVRAVTPLINRVGNGELQQHAVSSELVAQTDAMIAKAIKALVGAGRQTAADRLKALAEQFDLSKLAGKSYAEAMDELREMIKQAGSGQQGNGKSKGQGEAKDKGKAQGRGKAESETPAEQSGDAGEQDSKGSDGKEKADTGGAGQDPEQDPAEGEGEKQEQGKENGEEMDPAEDEGDAEQSQNDPADGKGKDAAEAKPGGDGKSGQDAQQPGVPGTGQTPQPEAPQSLPPGSTTPPSLPDTAPVPGFPPLAEPPPLTEPRSLPNQRSNRRSGGNSTEGREAPAPKPVPPPNCC